MIRAVAAALAVGAPPRPRRRHRAPPLCVHRTALSLHAVLAGQATRGPAASRSRGDHP